MISVVDAISSLGAVPLETDAWGIDVVVTGSQKALMTPPGLAFACDLRAGLGEVRRGDAAALLLGLGQGPHARRRRAARRSRPATSTVVALNAALGADPRRGPRARLRPSRRARASLPRRREGHGPRALLARRRQRRRAHGDPHACRESTPSRSGSRCATATGSRSRAVTATSSTGSSGSATSATSTSSTSRRCWGRSSSSSSRWARRSSGARPVRPPSPHTRRQPDDARARAGVDRRRGGRAAALEVRRRRGSDDADRRDHRPLRRDRDPLGDEAHGRPDRACDAT